MSCFASPKSVPAIKRPGTISYPVLGETHGCVNGFSVGITLYTEPNYLTPGVHDDQEGFVVLEGTGWAKVGDEEFRLEPEVCFVAPAGRPHAIKRDANVPHLKVCWFHGAIK